MFVYVLHFGIIIVFFPQRSEYKSNGVVFFFFLSSFNRKGFGSPAEFQRKG